MKGWCSQVWKAPNRPTNQITQSYNDGVVKIYNVGDIAQPGYRPGEGLTLKLTLRYDEQRIGINRLYMSRQNQTEIERVLRVPRNANISNQDVAITEDGRQYRIDYVQSVTDIWPDSLDLSLTKVEQEYEVPG